MVTIYDTTLRDGNQGLGISLSLKDKLNIAIKLNELGVHYIEGGWPNPTNVIDTEFYKEIKKYHLTSKITAFGSTRRPKIKACDDQNLNMLIATDAPVVTIFGKSWDLHVTQVLGTTLDENIDMISDSINYLKNNVGEVIYDAEHFFDGYKANPKYAIKTLMAAYNNGASTVVLCDTNGGLLPEELQDIFQEVLNFLPKDVKLGVHFHNDSGCADANSYLGVMLGASQVQGTINGYGERCGNANLCTVIPNLQLKRNMEIISSHQLKLLKETSVFVSEIANITHNIRLPYVGKSAFSHKAGSHADGVRKISSSFEHISPKEVGNARQFIVSDQAGSSTIVEKLKNIVPNIDKKSKEVQLILSKIKQLESEGYQYEAAEASFEIIAREILGQFVNPFEVIGFRVIEEKSEKGGIFSEATIKIRDDKITVHTAADGNGPVNALDNALRKALVEFYPSINSVSLEDYKVRVLDETKGTAAKVRVLIESSDGKRKWGTVGVSKNVIEASWLALIDSMKYKLMMDKLKD